MENKEITVAVSCPGCTRVNNITCRADEKQSDKMFFELKDKVAESYEMRGITYYQGQASCKSCGTASSATLIVTGVQEKKEDIKAAVDALINETDGKIPA